MSLKMSRKWDQKWDPEIAKNEIAGLRHFLPRHAFFYTLFMVWSVFLNLSFFARFDLEVFLGFLWTQKRVKTIGFLRFLNMQLFGSLKLLMALWAHLCPFLQEMAIYVGPKWASKIAFFMYQNRVFQFCKKNTKKKNGQY